MQAQFSRTILFYLVTSYYDSCCSYFSLFSIYGVVSSFHDAEFMLGGRASPVQCLWARILQRRASSCRGVICFTWVGSIVFLVFSLEAHGGRKESPRGTTVITMFSSLRFPPASLYSSFPILLSSPPVLCEHDVNSERSDYLSFSSPQPQPGSGRRRKEIEDQRFATGSIKSGIPLLTTPKSNHLSSIRFTPRQAPHRPACPFYSLLAEPRPRSCSKRPAASD